MKHSKLLLVAIMLFCSIGLNAQPKESIILKAPQDWNFERMDFPLGFAPEIQYKGFEELRFAPGMYDTTSVYYFTYVFVVSIEGIKELSIAELQNFLNKYYKGLCMSIGKDKKNIPDTALVNAKVKELPVAGKTGENFEATITYFDTFSKGQKIELTLNLQTAVSTTANKSYLIVLVAGNKATDEVWEKLRSIRNRIILP